MARKRSRNMQKMNDPVFGPVEGTESDEDATESISESIPEPRVIQETTAGEIDVSPQSDTVITSPIMRAIYDGPYTVDGVGVLDASGVRVAIAGYDNTRSTSGLGLAWLIADSLNKAILR